MFECHMSARRKSQSSASNQESDVFQPYKTQAKGELPLTEFKFLMRKYQIEGTAQREPVAKQKAKLMQTMIDEVEATGEVSHVPPKLLKDHECKRLLRKLHQSLSP